MLAAKRLEQEGRWRAAADKYHEVLEMMPDNQAAREGHQAALQMLNEGSVLSTNAGNSVPSGMAGVTLLMQEQRQRALVEFKDAQARAEMLLDQERYGQANRAMITAQVKLKQSRQYLSETEWTELNAEASALLQRIDESRMNAQLLKNQADQEEASRSRSAAEQQEQTERERIIRESLIRVRKLQEELKYREALQVVDEILFIDPFGSDTKRYDIHYMCHSTSRCHF